jgi:hypothetical protein
VPVSLTRREKWGRLWLAVFFLFLLVFCIHGLALSLINLGAGGQFNITKHLLLPLSELCLLTILWTGEPWVRWVAIIVYGLRGGTYVWLVTMLVMAMRAATPPEHAAAGRKVFLILLPGLAVILVPAVIDWGMCILLAFVPSVQAFLTHQRYANQGLWGALRDWWISRRVALQVSEVEIGEIGVHLGTILIADPMYISIPCRVGGLPVGHFPVVAQVIEYPEGGKRIAQVAIRFRAGIVTGRKTLGKVGVDSAMVIALDEQAYQEHWREVGPERIGMTHSPTDNRNVAALIQKKFGLRWRPIDGFRSMFLDPISEELEQQITEYLETFPNYAGFTVLYFRVETNNTFDRLMEAMSDASWCQLALSDDDESEYLIAFSSGFGDGSYDLVGVYHEDELLAVEITFIGPEQDRILESFPFLRESLSSSDDNAPSEHT